MPSAILNDALQAVNHILYGDAVLWLQHQAGLHQPHPQIFDLQARWTFWE